MSRKRKRIRPLRVVLSTGLMFVFCLCMVLAVRLLREGIFYSFVAIIGGICCTLVAASILEWFVHRHIYHRQQFRPLAQIYRIHHQGHHAAIFPTWRYTTNGPVRRHPISETNVSNLYPAGWRNILSKVAHFCFYMGIGFVCIWTPAWVMTESPLFLASIMFTSAVVSDLFVRVHDAIHYPGRFKFVESQAWFPFIDRHHFIHHVDMEANLNFLLPLADWCYGTLRTTMTAAEVARHGTLAEAKACLLGHSEPAVEFASERKRA